METEQIEVQFAVSSYLMVVTVPVSALGDVFETVVVQQTKEARITRVAKISGTNLLLENLGDVDFEGPSMRHPANVVLVSFRGQNVVDFLRKRHVLDLLRLIILHIRRDNGEITVGMIHDGTRLLDNDNGSWLDWEVELFFSPPAARGASCLSACWRGDTGSISELLKFAL